MHKLCERIEKLVLREFDHDELTVCDMDMLANAAVAMHNLAAYDLAKRQLDAQDAEMHTIHNQK